MAAFQRIKHKPNLEAIPELDIPQFRKIFNRLGREELISILEKHFLNEYKLEDKRTPRFTRIRGDTLVLVYERTAALHFRVVMKSIWEELYELFPCLPEDYREADADIYGKVLQVSWDRTFTQVANLMWKCIRDICTQCVGKDKTCKIEDISKKLIKVSNECHGKESCVREKVSRVDMWKMLGLLGLSLNVPHVLGQTTVPGYKQNMSTLVVRGVTDSPGTGNALAQGNGNALNSNTLIVQSRNTSQMKAAKAVSDRDFARISERFSKVITNYKMDAPTLSKHMTSAMWWKRGTSSNKSAIGELQNGMTRFSSKNKNTDNADNIKYLDGTAKLIATIIATATGLVLSVRVTKDKNLIVDQMIYEDENGDEVVVSFDAGDDGERLLLEDFAGLMKGMVHDAIKAKFHQLEAIVAAAGLNALPPVIAFGFQMDEIEEIPLDDNKHDDVAVAVILADPNDADLQTVLDNIHGIHEIGGEHAQNKRHKLVGIDPSLGIGQPHESVRQNFQTIGNILTEDLTDEEKEASVQVLNDLVDDKSMDLVVQDGELTKLTINGKDAVSLDQMRKDLSIEYSNAIKRRLEGKQIRTQEQIFAVIVLNKENEESLDLAAHIDLMHTTFSEILKAFDSGKEDEIAGKYGENVFKTYDALKVAQKHLTTAEFDERFQGFALELYDICSEEYINQVLARSNIKREEITAALEPDSGLREQIDALLIADTTAAPVMTAMAWSRIRMENAAGRPSAILEVIRHWTTGATELALAGAETAARFVGLNLPSVLYNQDMSLKEALSFVDNHGGGNPLDMANASPENIWFVAKVIESVKNNNAGNALMTYWPAMVLTAKIGLFLYNPAGIYAGGSSPLALGSGIFFTGTKLKAVTALMSLDLQLGSYVGTSVLWGIFGVAKMASAKTGLTAAGQRAVSAANTFIHGNEETNSLKRVMKDYIGAFFGKSAKVIRAEM